MSAVHTAHRFAAFRHVGYRRYFVSRFLAYFAVQIMSVSVGWQIYDLTRDPFALGLIGLFQFLPSLLLILVTGSVADRYNRRVIMGLCMLVGTLCAAALLVLTVTGLFAPWPVYAILIVFGIERAFLTPAAQSLAPNLVPVEDLPNAIAWNSSSWQTATIVGPVAGGLIYGLGPMVPYTVSLCFFAAAALMVFAVPKPAQRSPASAQNWQTITAGFRYIKADKVVLGAISLDLFAVLLGGAVALMPVFARDILVLGPWGLGLLRAAPGVGAVGMAIWLAAHPIRNRVGLSMFVGVALFGLATIVFGLSATPWISIAALVVMGAADMISVYVRESLIALWTPDELRGRVNAVNAVFVGASNELGEFRAGTMAAGFGAVFAVVFGGLGTLLVSLIWATGFPQLRRIDRLDVPERRSTA
ncbi:MFS transporter [Sinorhizobium americanum]|uniref:Major facilitator superfamily protein n=1 Tax=Sinorhizobium americanum TaxID=194963 RepID=A0A1L3LRR3_9HYPH|nr:MFS transporter [Sinorhizobium americanum]APG92772.1 major facilitator superfamily protein [Sinorhizobium americanum]OAP47826.1 MFS transporter [Sinorhizobium americanum]